MIRRIALVALLIIGIGSAILWTARRSIADDAIASALAKRGIPARFKVVRIGFGWQRLENISLGNPARPDLTADWAEVRLIAGWNGVTADAIRVGGARLRGRLIDGKVSWGVLDKLVSGGTAGAFSLPAIDVALIDARLSLATPYGPVGAKLDGRGRLSDGFSGKLAAVMPVVTAGSCRIERATAWVDLVIRRGSPAIKGPLRAKNVDCAGISLLKPRAAVDIVLGATLDSWRGRIAPEVDNAMNAQGFASEVRGTVAFSGNPRETKGSAKLTSARNMVAANRIDGATLDGRFAITAEEFDWQGRASAARVTMRDETLRMIGSFARAGDGTPMSPIVSALAAATLRASKAASGEAKFSANNRSGKFVVAASAARIASASGAVLRVAGGRGLGFDGTAITADTRLTLSGGGFPAIGADFVRTANGESRGTARISPLVAGDTRLALAPVRFLIRGNGYVRLVTIATLDGPFSGGRIDGLRTPIVVARLPDGSVAANPGCAPLTFRRLAVQSLVLSATTLGLCSEGPMLLRFAGGRLTGGAIVGAPRLAGAIGSTPLALSASQARIGFGDRGVLISNLTARLGGTGRISRLAIATLDGRIANGGIAGRFANLSGQIGQVPLLIDGGAGDWRFTKGALDLSASAMVSDELLSPRFNPLAAQALKLRLAENHVTATATLREPNTETQVATVDLSHDLNAGAGRATLDVVDLRFNSRFQPEALTSLTLGVVASVQGMISGRGNIVWNDAGVTSTGRFASNGLDFAAAFGPVDGAAGEVVFTDLLGLVTAPGQVVTLASVNPGVPVLGGRVTYRIEPGRRIVVEDGRWPFAGGALVMVPTLLDMSDAQERRLTFRVVGLDAAKFVETLQFENLAATGVFDGSIPIVFNAEGARIEAGEIVARRGGGTIAYVGEVSNVQMNVYAKMAFDALKAIRYSNLAIGLNGPLDGEMVSNVVFRGVNQDPASKPKGIVARAIRGLPFRFNIVIRAPFRSLLTTARDLQDPTALIRRAAPLPPPPGAQPVQPIPVQSGESEKR